MIAGAVSIFQRPLLDHAVWPVPRRHIPRRSGTERPAGTLIAQAKSRGTHPHTLVTANLNELRAALSEDPDNTRSQSVSWARELGLLER